MDSVSVVLPAKSYGEAFWEADDLMTILRKDLYRMERGEITAELVRLRIPMIMDRLTELERFLSDVSVTSSGS
jgi:hypothetical protein